MAKRSSKDTPNISLVDDPVDEAPVEESPKEPVIDRRRPVPKGFVAVHEKDQNGRWKDYMKPVGG